MAIVGSRSLHRYGAKPGPLPTPTKPVIRASGDDSSGSLSGQRLHSLPRPSGVRPRFDQPSASAGSTPDLALDAFLENCLSHPFADSLEHAIRDFMHFHDVIFWLDIPALGLLYSETRNLIAPYNACLAGFCRTAGTVSNVANPTKHGCYGESIDGPLLAPGGGVVMVPLSDGTRMFGVLELVKQGVPGPEDLQFAEWFARKLRLLKTWIDPPEIDRVLIALGQFGLGSEFFMRAAEALGCRVLEVWKRERNSMIRYGIEKGDGLALEGLVNEAIVSAARVNKLNAKDAIGFAPSVDRAGEAVLCVPVGDSYAVVLRGANRGFFTVDDEARVEKLSRHILVRLADGGDVSGVEDPLSAVSVSLAAHKEPEKALASLLEKCRSIVEAERCTFFLVSEKGDRLISCHQTGLRKCINIPLNRGLAGRAVIQKQAILEARPYQAPGFDPRVDAKIGFRTKSVLAVPTLTIKGDAVGCLEFLNKTGGRAFDESDSRTAQIFAAIAVLISENIRLTRDSAVALARAKLVAQMSIRASQFADWHQFVEETLGEAQAALHADRAAFYVESGPEFELMASKGQFLPTLSKSGIAQRILGDNHAIIDPAFSSQELDGQDSSTTGSLLALPVLSVGPKAVGLVCFLSSKRGFFNENHLDFIHPFATFCGLAIRATRPEDIEIVRWLTPEDRSLTKIPPKLRLTTDEITTVSSIACFSPDFKGIGHFKELFFFFDALDFLGQFQITADRFFRFLYSISGRYTSTPYHNWMHACDVTQCMYFMIRQGQLEETCTSWELFSLLVSGICHDTGHEGLNNVYNVKAETPLGILYKDLSVLEIHHIHESLPIIRRPDINLFGGFDESTSKKVWTLFVKIILATDMARHFDLLKRATTALDEGVFDITIDEWKLLALQLVMKVADISNVSRPFGYADKWCDILNEEFFHQGDLEKQSIGLTAPLNDRETSNKPKSQIGFYTFICVPLYTLVTRLFPGLQVQLDSVKSNLEHWKELAA
jgi:3',5'-cyclic-nucleotide phosphodiesterase